MHEWQWLCCSGKRLHLSPATCYQATKMRGCVCDALRASLLHMCGLGIALRLQGRSFACACRAALTCCNNNVCSCMRQLNESRSSLV
jgi:hypothetical protein